jgi:uncharacterized protein
MKKWIIRGAFLSGAIFTVALFGASQYFYNLSVARTKKDFLQNNEDLKVLENQEESEMKFDPYQWLESNELEKINLVADDGLTLIAHYLKAPVTTNKMVILAHGYSSKGKDMADYAHFFNVELGFNVLMPDARGHGESEGDYIGFGWHERLDYLKWIDYLIERQGSLAEIVLFGVSMGGATVMMTSGEALPEQVKAMIEDCGYTSVKEQLGYQLDRMYRLPEFPLLYTTSMLTKIRVGYDFEEASALEQVKKAKIPMLFIHGDQDTFVPTEMVYRLYEACGSEQKDLYIVEGAGHGLAMTEAGSDYRSKITSFIKTAW